MMDQGIVIEPLAYWRRAFVTVVLVPQNVPPTRANGARKGMQWRKS